MHRVKLTINDVMEAVNAMESDDQMSEMSDEDDGWNDATEDAIERRVEAVNDDEDNDEDVDDPDGDQRNDKDTDNETEIDEGPSTSRPQEFRFRRHHITIPAVRQFPEPAEDDDPYAEYRNKSPVELLKCFINPDMIELITFETNRYCVDKMGRSINVTEEEMEAFLGIYFLMGIVRMPATRDYCCSDLRYDKIANSMSRNRFEELVTCLHFVSNGEARPNVQEGQPFNRMWKLQPWIDAVKEQFKNFPNTENQSIDEIMVAFKGRSLLKQYVPNKPKKWGFKLWARCGSGGFCHDFGVYQGRGTGISDDAEIANCGLGGNVVLQLAKSLPPNIPYKLYADNFFSNFNMALELKKRGLEYTGTIRKNRVHGAPLLTEEALKAKGRGALDCVQEVKTGLILVRWFDNKAVTLISTNTGREPAGTVSRYNKSTKTRDEVTRPRIVEMYNRNMGGVDLQDMMCALYKKLLKGKRWYMYIFFHTLSMCCVNAWFIYRRLGNKIKLKIFQGMVSDGLLRHQMNRIGRPRRNRARMNRRIANARICESRLDGLDHWPVSADLRGRCRICQTKTFVRCTKCNVHVCFIPRGRNCFIQYHGQ